MKIKDTSVELLAEKLHPRILHFNIYKMDMVCFSLMCVLSLCFFGKQCIILHFLCPIFLYINCFFHSMFP